MTEATTPTPATRQRVFGREYNYADSVGYIVTEGDEAKIAVDYNKLPDAMKVAFGLQAYMDYVASAATETFRETGDKTEAQAASIEAVADAEAGKVEFRGGTGLGLSSAPAARLVGRALIETGKKFVMFKGQRYNFEGDEAKAIEVMKMLYADTSENTVDGHKRTGRQFFNLVSDLPDVAEKVRSYRKPKPSVAKVTEGAIG